MTGGGTAGHITPILSVARALKKADPDCEVVYIGLKGGKLEDRLLDGYQNFDEVHAITAGKFRRYHGQSFLAHLIDILTIALNIRDFFKVMAGTVSANKLLKKIKPDLVFSKGGFVAVPVGLAARWHKIPIVTHDSDAVSGLANRIVGRWAKIHATGLPASFYLYPTETVRYVGIPVDDRVKLVTPAAQAAFKAELDLKPDELVLLVAGGSLGAKTLNDLVLQIAVKLLAANPSLHIINIAGSKNEAELTRKYKSLTSEDVNKRVTVLAFTPKLYKYTGAADLILARAGASTLAELAIQQKALIVIPSPYLTGGHQLKNAAELEKTAAAEVLPNNISADDLLKAINSLLNDRPRREELAKRLGTLAKPDAADELAQLLLEVTNARQ